MDADEPDYGEEKSSPFSFSPDQGLLEQVAEAVRPLTDTGDFRLESISYCDSSEDGGSIRLTSPGLAISFLYNLRVMETVSLFLRVVPLKEPFEAKPLFAARRIPITFRSWELPGDISDRARLAAQNGRTIIPALLRETGFIDELYRLCGEIRANLPALRDAFAPENLDETLRRYAIEHRKPRQVGGASRSPARQRRSACAGTKEKDAEIGGGKIEKIFEALQPIDRLYRHKTVYYDVACDRFDIDALQSDSTGCDMYFRSGADDELRAYFFGYIPEELVHGRTPSGNPTESSFFPAANVFDLLDVDDSIVTEWRTTNLHALCEVVADNATGLFRAFSMENKAKTFAALMAMGGSDSETIRRARDSSRRLVG